MLRKNLIQMKSRFKGNYKLTSLLLFIIIIATSEDFFRRLIPVIPSTIVFLKTSLLLLFIVINQKIIYKYSNKLFRIWSILLFVILLPHLLTLEGIFRSVIWLHAIVFLPILIVLSFITLDDVWQKKVFKVVSIVALLCGIFAFYTYSTGAYAIKGAIWGPLSGSYKFYEGQRVYFNAGWFFGAERLTWVMAIGVASVSILIKNKKKFINQIPFFLTILFFLFISFTTTRLTGFLLTIAMLIIISIKVILRNKIWLIIFSLIFIIAFANIDVILKLISSDSRALFVIDYSGTADEKGLFHLTNVSNAIKYSTLLGYGPIPQGIQYIDTAVNIIYFIHTEGLISHSIVQFGILSVIHITFNFIFFLLALRAIFKYDDYKFILGVLLLILKIWIVKASQMESDLFAQFMLYLMITPLIKSYLIEKKHIMENKLSGIA